MYSYVLLLTLDLTANIDISVRKKNQFLYILVCYSVLLNLVDDHGMTRLVAAALEGDAQTALVPGQHHGEDHRV